jgi:hypothetical protein
MDEFDQKLIDYAMDVPESYSAFQMVNFVINTQVGDFKQLKQYFLEIATREQARMIQDLACKQNEADTIEKEERLKTDEELTKHERASLELELIRSKYDLRINVKKHKQATLELEVLLKSVKERYGDMDKIQDYLETNNEEKERHYWISRMSKQAAIDIVTNGSIGLGNMDAIVGMSEKDQVLTLVAALQFSGKVSDAMKKIEEHVNENYAQLVDNQPGLEHSAIQSVLAEKLLLEGGKVKLPPSESKVEGEPIT